MSEAKKKALVVDDDLPTRMVIQALLTAEGYQVIYAANGLDGVERFRDEGADLVVMDVMMPEMDGFEATRRIKALSGDRFVPVILVTALSEGDAIAKGIAAGADDFLHKPFKRPTIRAKITALDRIRTLQEKERQQRKRLAELHYQLRQDQMLAERVFNQAVSGRNAEDVNLRTIILPAATFSGDLVLSARLPTQGFHVLLGDFTGHGLAAAIGAIPVSETFHSMTHKGFVAEVIVQELNKKLCDFLPTGMFMGCCFIVVDPTTRLMRVWNAGMPDMLVYESSPKQSLRRIPSAHFPLGIAASDIHEYQFQNIPMKPDSYVFAYSDGLIESRNYEGAMFKEEQLIKTLTEGEGGATHRVKAAWEAHCGGCPQDDDVTMVEVTCCLGEGDSTLANHN